MTQHNTKMVYKQIYAAKLMKMGHVVLETLPNPRYPQNNMWLFAIDETFNEDLATLQREAANGR